MKKMLSRVGTHAYDMVGSKSHADMWETIQTISLWFIAYSLRVGLFILFFILVTWTYIHIAPDLYNAVSCLISSCP